MTRKHYLYLARALNTTRPTFRDSHCQFEQWRRDCESIAATLAADNRAFDRDLFLVNCGCAP